MRVEQAFRNDAQFVAHARRFVTDAVGDAPRAFLFDVQLMASELVNNAILHAESECTVAVEIYDDLITVSVTDAGSGRPQIRTPGHETPSGRGLRIVDALADAWGIEAVDPPPGSIVWFRVQRPGRSEADHEPDATEPLARESGARQP